MKKRNFLFLAILSLVLFSACEMSPELQEYSITYSTISGGGTGTMDSQNILEGSSADLNMNRFLSDDNSFLGWSSTPDGSVEYENGASYTMGSGDVTLYAIWGKIRVDSLTFVNTDVEEAVTLFLNIYSKEYVHEVKSITLVDVMDSKDLTDLEIFTSVTYLIIANNDISDISSLKPLTALSYIDLGGNKITDISFLQNFTHLEDIILSINNITDGVASLVVLTNATTIDLRHNPDIPAEDVQILRAALEPSCTISD